MCRKPRNKVQGFTHVGEFREASSRKQPMNRPILFSSSMVEILDRPKERLGGYLHLHPDRSTQVSDVSFTFGKLELVLSPCESEGPSFFSNEGTRRLRQQQLWTHLSSAVSFSATSSPSLQRPKGREQTQKLALHSRKRNTSMIKSPKLV